MYAYDKLKPMKRFVNVRLLVIFALSLCTGIGLGILLYFYDQSIAWALAAAVPSALIILIWSLAKRRIIKPLIFVLLPLLLFIGGALNSYYCIDRFNYSEIDETKEYAIHGHVKEKGKTANGEYIIISDITLNNKKIAGNAYVYLEPTYGELCDEGYTVDFTAVLEKIAPFQYGELTHYAEQNVKYRTAVYAGLHSTYGFSFFGSMRRAIKNTLFSNLDENTAAISYAMLTGNTEQVDDTALDSFRYGGVSHIFAVSGLHVGIIFAFASFILKKLRLNRHVSAVISLAIVFLYSAMCGFTLSSLRAAIMCTVAKIANLLKIQYDGLNSLSVAVIIILSATPLSLLSVGFQLSVCAIGGIYCFSKYITKLLNRIKCPPKLSSAIGTSIGAQLGTLPIMLSSFGYISGAGLLLNIVVLPLLSVVFVIMLSAILLCATIGILAPYVIPYAALPLQFIVSLLIGAGFENSVISGFGAGLFVPLYFIFVICAGDKINLRLITRGAVLICGIGILTAYVLIRYNMPFSGYNVTVSAYSDGEAVFIKSNSGTVLIVSDEVNSSRIKNMLNDNYVTEIDALIILGEDNLDVYPSLDVGCKNIYVCNAYPQIQPYGDIKITYAGGFTECGVEFFLYDENTLLASVGGVDIGICTDTNYSIKSCDIFISDEKAEIDFKTQVFFTNRAGSLNVFDCGDITFEINDGSFRLASEIPPVR